MSGAVVYKQHTRVQLRPYFRPYVIGLVLTIGLAVLWQILGRVADSWQ